MKQQYENMYLWICNYSRGVHEDVGVLSWLLEMIKTVLTVRLEWSVLVDAFL